MRKLIFLLGFVTTLLFTGCNSNEVMEPPINESMTILVNSEFGIDESEALSIAGNLLGQLSRSESSAKVDYILSSESAKESLSSDVLAYVINYDDNGGFAIIASDKRINPVLAFSDTGSFSFDNELSRLYFLDKVEEYITTEIEQEQVQVADYNAGYSDLFPVTQIGPFVVTNYGQRAPYNKYVSEVHPNCITGCVPVAVATIMTHAKDKLAYDNFTFYFSQIRKLIDKQENTNAGGESLNSHGPITGPLPTNLVPTTYDMAIDHIAQLMYKIGRDIGVTYGTSATSGDSSKGQKLMSELGYECTPYLYTTDISKVLPYLLDSKLIMMRGDSSKDGHAWVCDGAKILCKGTSSERIFYHMDWGWYGESNGYFQGDIFSVIGSEYRFGGFTAVTNETL